MTSQALLNQVATHLAGRPVIVRVQPPVRWFAGGSTSKNMDGVGIIDIDPGSLDVFMTLLHEIAHAKLDLPTLTPSDYWRLDPGSQTLPDTERAELRALPRESEADKLAAVWANYALKYYYRYSGDNGFDAKLKCLADYPMHELLDAA